MRNERHNCGGILRNKQVAITKNIGGLFYTFTVEGKQCTSCSEEVISRDTLRKLEVLPVRARITYSKKRGAIFTLDTPIIGLLDAGTATDSISRNPTVDTGRVAYAHP